MNAYWFARRHAVGEPGDAMGPISWEGWAIVAAFTVALLASGLVLMLLSIVGMVAGGVVLAGGLAGLSTFALLKAVTLKGDTTRSIADYHEPRRAAPAGESEAKLPAEAKPE